MLIMGHRIRIGGEQISLNANYPDADKFRASGYEEITTNDTYKGGVVRQYGGFSFSRVFDAGHAGTLLSPSFACETPPPKKYYLMDLESLRKGTG